MAPRRPIGLAVDGVTLGSTGQAISHTFNRKTIQVFDPETKTKSVEVVLPTGVVVKAGYHREEIPFHFA